MDIHFTNCVEHKQQREAELALGTYSRDCKYLATNCYKTKNIKIWDTVTFQLLQTLEGHEQFVTSIAFSMDGKYLATISGTDGTLRIWDMGSFEVLEVHKMHEYGDNFISSRDLMFSPNNNILEIMCHDGIRLLDWPKKVLVKEILFHPFLTCFAFVGNNHFLFFNSKTNGLNIMDANTFQDVYYVTKKFDYVQSISTSPQYIIICCDDHIRILDAITFQEIYQENHDISHTEKTVISGNGTYFATFENRAYYNEIHIYKMSTFQKVKTHQLLQCVMNMMFSSDEKSLMILCIDGTIMTLS